MEQRQKLERRMLHTKSELQSMKCNVSNLSVLLEARTKFIQTGLVDVSEKKKKSLKFYVKLNNFTKCFLFSFTILIIYFQADVANELEEDVSSLQVRCDELALQVTQLTQGKGNLILLLKRGLLRITLLSLAPQ